MSEKNFPMPLAGKTVRREEAFLHRPLPVLPAFPAILKLSALLLLAGFAANIRLIQFFLRFHSLF
jgi:hypothetical protein